MRVDESNRQSSDKRLQASRGAWLASNGVEPDPLGNLEKNGSVGAEQCPRNSRFKPKAAYWHHVGTRPSNGSIRPSRLHLKRCHTRDRFSPSCKDRNLPMFTKTPLG